MAKNRTEIAGLCSLPPELLLEIASYLQPAFRACFALICKGLKDVVGPGTLTEYPNGEPGELQFRRRDSAWLYFDDTMTTFLHLLKRDLAPREYIICFDPEKCRSPRLLKVPSERALLDISRREISNGKTVEPISGHTQCPDLRGSLRVGGALSDPFQAFRSPPVYRSPHCALATWIKLIKERKDEKEGAIAYEHPHHNTVDGTFNWSASGDDCPENLFHKDTRTALSKIRAFVAGDKLYRAYEYDNITRGTKSLHQIEVEMCKHRLIGYSDPTFGHHIATRLDFGESRILRCDPCNLKCRVLFKPWSERHDRWPVQIRKADVTVEIAQDLSSVH
jgi:hypothetical protein